MANHNLPTLTSTYANFVTEIDARMDDISIGFDPAVTTVTNMAVGTIRWVSGSNKWEKWSGTTWTDLSSAYAINISGNAATATKLANARTINGVNFDGTANITVGITNSLTINNAGGGAASGSTFNGSAAIIISYNTVGAPSTTGTNATGTWDININGNAATVTNGVYTSGVQSIGGVKTFTSGIVGKTGGTDTTASISIATTGGSYASMYSTRRGTPYLTTISHTGSSYAPALGIQYEYTGSYQGIYSLGHLAQSASNPGSFVIHHINSGGTADVAWAFAGLTGDFTAAGNVTAYSDERLKTNWKDLDKDFIEKLACVKMGTFERTDTCAIQVGVGAHSLNEILPSAVQVNPNGMLSVSYGNAAMASCVALAREIMALKAEIAALKG